MSPAAMMMMTPPEAPGSGMSPPNPWAFGSGPLLGLTYGVLHVLGPDHLGTVLALSVPVPPREAFSVGFSWSLGHCAGMVAVAMVALALQKLTKFDVHKWETAGDYIIGLSMVICALYFIVRESSNLEEQVDGSVSLKTCCCHGPAKGHIHHGFAAHRQGRRRERGSGRARAMKGSKLCLSADFGGRSAPQGGDGADASDEEAPLLPPPPISAGAGDAKSRDHQDQFARTCSRAFSAHDLKGALLGVLQGMCCPMGIVGVVFLANLPPASVSCFLVVFLLVSALGTGALASGMSWLVNNKLVNSGSSSKWLYRLCCGFTLLLGVAWIGANYFGVLGWLNYTEGGMDMSGGGDDTGSILMPLTPSLIQKL